MNLAFDVMEENADEEGKGNEADHGGNGDAAVD